MYAILPAVSGVSVVSTVRGLQRSAPTGGLTGDEFTARAVSEKADYQKKLATLLTEVCCRSKVPNVVDIALLAFPVDLRRLYFIANRAYWSREFHFEARIQERQWLLP